MKDIVAFIGAASIIAFPFIFGSFLFLDNVFVLKVLIFNIIIFLSMSGIVSCFGWSKVSEEEKNKR